jgi:hypothetical protein
MINYIPMYNFDLLPVLVSLVFLTAVVLWVAISNYKNFILMVVLIPLAIYAGWTIYVTIDRLLGYPVPDDIKKDSMYISHLEDTAGDWIYVWLVIPGDQRPKAIMVPNTKGNKQALEEAQQKAEQGQPQGLETVDGEESGGGETQGGEIRSYDFVDQAREFGKDSPTEEIRGVQIDGTRAGPVERRSTNNRPPPPSLNGNRTEQEGLDFFDRMSETPEYHPDNVNPFKLDWGWPDGTTEEREVQGPTTTVN